MSGLAEPWWPIEFEEDGCATLRGHPVVLEVVAPTENDPAMMSDHKGRTLALCPVDLVELRCVLLELAGLPPE